MYTIFVCAYFIWVFFLVGLRIDHYYFLAIFSACYFVSERSHKMTWGLIFFIIFWIIYDGMRVLPNYEVNPVHVKEVYDFEKSIFGLMMDGERVTINEYLMTVHHPIYDFLAGSFYILWMPAPLAFAVYLFYKNQVTLINFSAAFLLTNLIGFTVYYLYPAAPPWYVEFHGFEENFTIPGNAAYLTRFDEMIGFPLYQNMYNKNANVFAAIPSMHSAFPVLLFFFAMKNRYRKLSICFLVLMLGIWFAAIYSLHHYLIDVILGIICAIFALILYEKAILKSPIKNHISRFAKYIQ